MTRLTRKEFLVFLCNLSCFQKIDAKPSKQVQISKMFSPETCNDFPKTETGDTITVHYTGYLENGQVFDSSVHRNRDPITFILGVRNIIEGWNVGLLDMCKGEKRRIIIPPNLAYGDAGFPPAIPGKATLTFEVELVDMRKAFLLRMILGSIVEFVKVIAPGLILALVCYKLYSKFQEDSMIKKEKQRREQKNAKMARKRRS